jgi:hypothetical protein
MDLTELHPLHTAGYKIGKQHQVLLRRSKREYKARRFLRPDSGPASHWRDDTTTAMEESGKAGKIPEAIVGKNYAAPFLPTNFTIRESQVDNACVPTVRKVPFKQEPVDDKVEEFSDDEEKHVPIMDAEACKMTRAGRMLFDPLPLVTEFKTVPSDDDDTVEMSTVDKENDTLTCTNMRDFYAWEMRK